MERELAAELAELESLIAALPLAESARVSLDTELRYTRDMEERTQVLCRWLAGLQHAYAMNAALIAHRERAAEMRSTALRQQEWRHSIWRKPWRLDE